MFVANSQLLLLDSNLETFNNLLNPNGRPFVEASAINGDGVFETLREIAKVSVPLIKEIVVNKKSETSETENTQTKVEFVSPKKIAPIQMTKIKLETRDDVDKSVKNLTKKVTTEENYSN